MKRSFVLILSTLSVICQRFEQWRGSDAPVLSDGELLSTSAIWLDSQILSNRDETYRAGRYRVSAQQIPFRNRRERAVTVYLECPLDSALSYQKYNNDPSMELNE